MAEKYITITRHGEARNRRQTPEYRTWGCMLSRCRNPNVERYPEYGGRGITVCDRWLDYKNFLADMGRRPSPSHSIERIDTDGNYEPGNCKWATRSEQARNRRPFEHNGGRVKLLTAMGETKRLHEWARQFGLHPGALAMRLRSGWDTETAITTPPQRTRSGSR